MADRFVTHTDKTHDGDITRLGNPRESWSPISAADVIREIENGVHTYYTGTSGSGRANVVVIASPEGKGLFTDRDGPAARHLLNLPDLRASGRSFSAGHDHALGSVGIGPRPWCARTRT
jgi:hypothetical protein